jgi:hypothetical protein
LLEGGNRSTSGYVEVLLQIVIFLEVRELIRKSSSVHQNPSELANEVGLA